LAVVKSAQSAVERRARGGERGERYGRERMRVREEKKLKNDG